MVKVAVGQQDHHRRCSRCFPRLFQCAPASSPGSMTAQSHALTHCIEYLAVCPNVWVQRSEESDFHGGISYSYQLITMRVTGPSLTDATSMDAPEFTGLREPCPGRDTNFSYRAPPPPADAAARNSGPAALLAVSVQGELGHHQHLAPSSGCGFIFSFVLKRSADHELIRQLHSLGLVSSWVTPRNKPGRSYHDHISVHGDGGAFHAGVWHA